ncbi:MAG TPA: hypothetical protein VFX50_16525 [Gemmatimonadales bacterium]|nr:hypothetical protein [Gemmatimonadales bacterium]
MSGHVFHPGHEELHGITVVVNGRSGRTYVGRYHERTERGILLHDVGTHDPATGQSREEYLARTLKFGVRADARHLVLADDEVGEIRKLAELE